MQWFSSGSTFSEYADGGHYKMSKTDKRENIILVRALYCPERAFGLIRILSQIASEPLTFEKGTYSYSGC